MSSVSALARPPAEKTLPAIRPDLARDLSRRGWLGVKDVAEVLGLCEKTVRRRIALFKGPSRSPLAIPVLPLGKPHRIPARWLRPILEEACA